MELDLAILLDCTGSMSGLINSLQRDLKQILQDLCSSTICSIVRMALVEFRDHPPQESTFVTRVFDFTSDVAVMQNKLDTCEADGGGDTPEAISDAMYESLENLSWNTDSHKVIVLCTDAYPHGITYPEGDHFPNGCPDGHDPIILAKRMAANSITLLVLSNCEIDTMFLAGICFITGGRIVKYNSNNVQVKQLMVSLILEDCNIETEMTRIHSELAEEADRMGTTIDEQELTRRMNNLTNLGKDHIPEKNMFRKVQIKEDMEKYLTFTNIQEARSYIEDLRKQSEAIRIAESRKFIKPKRSTGKVRTKIAKRVRTKISKRVRPKKLLKPLKPRTLKSLKHRTPGVRRSLRLQLRNEALMRALSITNTTTVADVVSKESQKDVIDEETVKDLPDEETVMDPPNVETVIDPPNEETVRNVKAVKEETVTEEPKNENYSSEIRRIVRKAIARRK